MSTQNGRTVLAVAVAVFAALGLAASVNYAFAPTTTQTQTTTPSNYQNCGNVTMVRLPQSIQLKENGTTTVNGTTYWYVSFIPEFTGPTSVVLFQGVTFTLTVPLLDVNVTGFEQTIENATMMTTIQGTGSACGYNLPSIKIAFSDGTSVGYNSETITVNGNQALIVLDKPTSNPWFTAHTSPQAGVGYQTSGGEMTLYVSTS
jgi:hypothetical protein